MRIFKKRELVNKEKRKIKKMVSEKSFTYAPLFKKTKKYIKKHSNILDAGCGEGNISLLLAMKENKVLGFDISREAIISAQKKSKTLNLEAKTNFLVQDIQNFNLNKKFDVIFCIEVLEHIKNDNNAIRNLSLHLKKNGLIIITVPSKNAPLYRLKSIKRYDKKIGHLRRYDEKELINKLKKENLESILVEKTEGLFRNSLFFTSCGEMFLKIANHSFLISFIFEEIDNVFLKLFGGSQITAIATKK